jgi:hypothetical protein
MPTQYAAKSEKLLEKIIGGFKEEERKADQYFECKVMSDIPEAAQVKKWIADLPRVTIPGYHIMATSPSIQLYAYTHESSEPITLETDWSMMQTAKADSEAEIVAVRELKVIIEKYCPTPSKTK